MTPQEKAQLDAQIKEIQDNTKKSENRNGKITIWVLGLATVLGIGNVAQGIAIKGLTPLKQPVPMIAVIDSETGLIDEKKKDEVIEKNYPFLRQMFDAILDSIKTNKY